MPIDAALLPSQGGTLGPTPPRAPWSVRRTSTIDITWPDGITRSMRAEAHGRDLLTGADPAWPTVLAANSYVATVTPEREIAAIATEPPRADIVGLIGSRAGSQLRGHIAEVLPDELRRGTPLYLLLDDLAGASLVSYWAWSQWDEDWFQRLRSSADQLADHRAAMAGICVGFSPDGPPVLQPHDQPDLSRPVPPLDDNGDPFGWHDLATTAAMVTDGPVARRARRIEVRFAGDAIAVETHFQDSTPVPGGGRMAVHEYLVRATVDRASLVLTSLTADPRILPFGYCTAATLNVDRVVGTPVAELRQRVLVEFAKTAGCTHLNDVMRSLAEVPVLAAELEQALDLAGAA